MEEHRQWIDYWRQVSVSLNSIFSQWLCCDLMCEQRLALWNNLCWLNLLNFSVLNTNKECDIYSANSRALAHSNTDSLTQTHTHTHTHSSSLCHLLGLCEYTLSHTVHCDHVEAIITAWLTCVCILNMLAFTQIFFADKHIHTQTNICV